MPDLSFFNFNFDWSSILSFFELPPYLILWDVFIYGGWVVILILLIFGIWNYWLMHIRKKFLASLQYILLTIDVPKNNEQGPEAVERLFAQLAGTRSGGSKIDVYFRGYVQPDFSFELVSLEGKIRYFIRIPVQFRDMIEAAIYSAYYDAEIMEAEDYINDIPDIFPDDEYDCWIGDLILYNKDYYPIRTYSEFEHSLSKELKDPLGVLWELMGKLGAGEHLWTQFIVTPINNDWKKRADNFVNKMLGIKISVQKNIGDYLLDGLSAMGNALSTGDVAEKKEVKKEAANLSPSDKKGLEAIQKKTSKISFKVKYRAVYVARKEVFFKNRGVVGFLGSISQFNTLDLNGFKPDDKAKTSKPMLFGARRLAKKQTLLMRAYKTRSRFIGAKNFVLNIEELATLYHFPAVHIKVPSIQKTGSKRGEPPIRLPLSQ